MEYKLLIAHISVVLYFWNPAGLQVHATLKLTSKLYLPIYT
jgi:hypothetical protein